MYGRQPIVIEETNALGEAAAGLARGFTRGMELGYRSKLRDQEQSRELLKRIGTELAIQNDDPEALEKVLNIPVSRATAEQLRNQTENNLALQKKRFINQAQAKAEAEELIVKNKMKVIDRLGVPLDSNQRAYLEAYLHGIDTNVLDNLRTDGEDMLGGWAKILDVDIHHPLMKDLGAKDPRVRREALTAATELLKYKDDEKLFDNLLRKLMLSARDPNQTYMQALNEGLSEAELSDKDYENALSGLASVEEKETKVLDEIINIKNEDEYKEIASKIENREGLTPEEKVLWESYNARIRSRQDELGILSEQKSHHMTVIRKSPDKLKEYEYKVAQSEAKKSAMDFFNQLPSKYPSLVAEQRELPANILMKQIRMRSQEISKEIKQEHGISISPEEVENIFIQQWKNNYIPTPDRSVVTKPDERGFFRKAGGGIVGAWTSYNPLKGFARGYYDERKVETEGGANLGMLLPKVPAQQAERIRDESEQPTKPEEKGKTKKLFEGKEEPAASEQTIIDTTDGSEEAQNKGLDKYKEGYSEEQADYIWDRLSKEEKTQLFRQKYAELVKDGKIDKTEMKYPDYREKAMQMIEDKIIDDLQGRGKEEEEWKSYSYKPVIDIKKGMQMIENKVIDYLKGRGKEE